MDGVISEKTKTKLLNQELHTWKKGTVLIMGDGMAHGIDERQMNNSSVVKFGCFPGSTVADLRKFLMELLLRKNPVK